MRFWPRGQNRVYIRGRPCCWPELKHPQRPWPALQSGGEELDGANLESKATKSILYVFTGQYLIPTVPPWHTWQVRYDDFQERD